MHCPPTAWLPRDEGIAGGWQEWGLQSLITLEQMAIFPLVVTRQILNENLLCARTMVGVDFKVSSLLKCEPIHYFVLSPPTVWSLLICIHHIVSCCCPCLPTCEYQVRCSQIISSFLWILRCYHGSFRVSAVSVPAMGVTIRTCTCLALLRCFQEADGNTQ